MLGFFDIDQHKGVNGSAVIAKASTLPIGQVIDKVDPDTISE